MGAATYLYISTLWRLSLLHATCLQSLHLHYTYRQDIVRESAGGQVPRVWPRRRHGISNRVSLVREVFTPESLREVNGFAVSVFLRMACTSQAPCEKRTFDVAKQDVV